MLGGGAALAAGAALVFSNPTPAEFELYAGERLVDLTTREICGDDGLPMLLGLLVQNCPELVHGQRKLLGSLAAANTRRFNAGLFSLYNTDVGGRRYCPGCICPVTTSPPWRGPASSCSWRPSAARWSGSESLGPSAAAPAPAAGVA